MAGGYAGAGRADRDAPPGQLARRPLGLTGPLLDPGSWRPRTAAVVVEQLIAHVAPALDAGGDLNRVEQSWAELQRRGTGAEEQRQLARDAGELTTVVREAVRRTS